MRLRGGPIADRFWQKVDKSGPCWEWLATIERGGYGRFYVNGRNLMAHRVSWVLAGRTLIPGLTLDHLCRNARCVNPDHLDQVTQRENNHRAIPASCKRGHTRWKDRRRGGQIIGRTCIDCQTIHQRTRRNRR